MSSPTTIECSNFELDNEDLDVKTLINHLVYSPSARYAATILKIDNRPYRPRFFLLDLVAMTLSEYRNEADTKNEDLRMVSFYWDGNDCLVLICASYKLRKIHQTPILLNHNNKTYQPKESVTYNSPKNFRIDAPSSREAKTITYERKRYVLLIGRPVRLFTYDIYAIPFNPYSTSQLKKFILSKDVDHNRTIINKTYHLGGSPKFSPQISVVNNIVYIPIEYHFRENMNTPKDLMGIHLAIEFEKLQDMTGTELIESFNNVTNFLNEQSAAVEYKEHVEVDHQMDWQLALNTFCRDCGASRYHNGNFFQASQIEHAGTQVTRVDSTDCTKRSVKTIHGECHPRESGVAISLTPDNILIAKKMSPNIISCSTIPYPFNDTVVPT